MGLNANVLKRQILDELEIEMMGRDMDSEEMAGLAEAISRAVVDHIAGEARVVVTRGSSSGTYRVQ